MPVKKAVPGRSLRNIVLALHGELDISKKRVIEEKLSRVERLTRAAVVILDLSDVAYLDTTFLNALMRTQRHVRNGADSRLRIVARGSTLFSRLFTIANLDEAFPLFEDVAAARRYSGNA